MAELLWFYHVAYQHPIVGGVTCGDTSITTTWRLDNDDKLHELREKLNELADGNNPRRTGPVVITAITLLARPGVSE